MNYINYINYITFKLMFFSNLLEEGWVLQEQLPRLSPGKALHLHGNSKASWPWPLLGPAARYRQRERSESASKSFCSQQMPESNELFLFF